MMVVDLVVGILERLAGLVCCLGHENPVLTVPGTIRLRVCGMDGLRHIKTSSKQGNEHA
jgi:hypothetical protein